MYIKKRREYEKIHFSWFRKKNLMRRKHERKYLL
jgi:hypothetical protein